MLWWRIPGRWARAARGRAGIGGKPRVHSDQGRDLALERMGTNQIEILPVVSRADVHKLEGVVTLIGSIFE